MAALADRADADLAARAETLCGRPVESIVAVRGGGNNRLHRVRAGGVDYALKTYPTQAEDLRDRLGVETAALAFLRRHGVDRVPAPIAAERHPEADYGLYEWIQGTPPSTVEAADIDAALAFAADLARLKTAADARDLPRASEACPAAGDLIRQIDQRRARLGPATQQEPALGRLLERLGTLQAAWAVRAQDGYARCGRTLETPLPPMAQTLSPSDFGFHNALRRANGTLAFIDFEYFGWDDPVRLAADFVLHPGMDLGEAGKHRFLAGCHRLFAADPFFATRLGLLYPLVGLRWCLILLNEFLPERWARRNFAGATDAAAGRARQLAKAERLLDQLESTNGEIPDGR